MSIEITSIPGAVATDAVVVATDLTKIYGEGDSEVRALDGVSVSFPKGQLAAVMGPSGSGKSTLMHILAGLDQPTSGSVLVDGTELAGLNDHEGIADAEWAGVETDDDGVDATRSHQ